MSTPYNDEAFDYEKLHISRLQNNVIEELEKTNGEIIEHIENTKVEEAIKKLKSGQTMDEDDISAENHKYAFEETIPLIGHILNFIIEHLDVPLFLKSGVLSSVVKRRISIRPIQQITET